MTLTFVVLFAATVVRAAPSLEDARVMSGIVAEAAGTVANVDVLTAEDVRAALDVEAARQLSGCDEAGCLAEIASALDAQLMITGTLGTLGDDTVLQLAVIDGKAARSVARKTLTARRAADLVTPARAFISEALTPLAKAPERPVRVVIVDFQLASGPAVAAQPEPQESGGLSPLVFVGGAALGVSLAALAAGVVFDAVSVMRYADADAASTSAADAREGYDASDSFAVLSGVSYVSGGVLVVAGAGLLGAGLLIE